MLKNDKSADVRHLIEELLMFHEVSDNESSSSRNSQSTDGQELTLNTFMESLSRSRRSSFMDLSDEISQLEEEIIQKSGVQITKNVSQSDMSASAAAALSTPSSQSEEEVKKEPEQEQEEQEQKREQVE